MAKVTITNQELFEAKVEAVHADGLKATDYYNGITGNFCASGHITIDLVDEPSIEATGEHGARDYEEEYGFILECKE